jgi:hypothetical protein
MINPDSARFRKGETARLIPERTAMITVTWHKANTMVFDE